MMATSRPILKWLRLSCVAMALMGAAGPALAQDAAPAPAPDDLSADAAPAAASIDPVANAGERFVPPSPNMNRTATLELRPDATIFGAAIHLKQLCRWSSADGPTMTPVADLTVAQFAPNGKRKTISLDELRTTLQDAGVNLAAIRFEGSLACTVTRGDFGDGSGNNGDDPAALQAWVANASATPSITPTAASVAAASPAAAAPADSSGLHTLRDLLLTDLSQRINLPVDTLDMNFDPKDQAVLNLSEPNFRFNLRPRMVRDLGDVSWDVTILTGGAVGSGTAVGQQHLAIRAQARAWQNQFVTVQSVAYGQVLRDQDVEARRVLIDTLPESPVLTHEQVVGQQAARDIQPGMVMNGRLVQAVPLARAGQYITVTLNSGTVQIRTVARAMEGGSYGQAIKVKDEATRELFEVTLVGPQQATMGAAPVQTASAGGG